MQAVWIKWKIGSSVFVFSLFQHKRLSSTGQSITSHVYTNFTNKIKFVNGKKIEKPNRLHSLFVKVTKKVAIAGNMVIRQILNSQ